MRPDVVWMRWRKWTAHAFVNGAQLCGTVHGRFQMLGKPPPVVMPRPCEVTPHGVPYGKVCCLCINLVVGRAGRPGLGLP